MRLEAIGNGDIVTAARMRAMLDLDGADDKRFYDKFIGSYSALVKLLRHPEHEVIEMAMEFLVRFFPRRDEAAGEILRLIERMEQGEKAVPIEHAEQKNGTSPLVCHAFMRLYDSYRQFAFVQSFLTVIVFEGECDGIAYGGERRELAANYLVSLLKDKCKGKFYEDVRVQRLQTLMVVSRDFFVQRGLIEAFRYVYEKEHDEIFSGLMMDIAENDPDGRIRGHAFKALKCCKQAGITGFIAGRIAPGTEHDGYARREAARTLLGRRDRETLEFFEKELFTGRCNLPLAWILEGLEHFDSEAFDAFLTGKLLEPMTWSENRRKICEIFLGRERRIPPEVAAALWNLCIAEADPEATDETLRFFKIHNKQKLKALLLADEVQEI